MSLPRQKHFLESTPEVTCAAGMIRDRLARLRERIEVTEDTVKLQLKEYACIQAAVVGDGCVGLVTLHRPKALNALSHALMLELVDALQTFDASTQVTCSLLQMKIC